MAAPKKDVAFNIEIPMQNDTKIYVGSADIAMQFYPPKNAKKNIGLIVNVARRAGKTVIDDNDKNCTVMYMILSEGSAIEQLMNVCVSVCDPISRTLFKQNQNVVIHCNEGRTRSPTIAYLYLLFILDWKQSIAKSYLPGSKFMPCIHSAKAKQLLPTLKQQCALSSSNDKKETKNMK